MTRTRPGLPLLRRRVEFNLRAAVRAFEDRRSGPIPYVGLESNGNLGDEELFRLARRHLGPRPLSVQPRTRGRFLRISVAAADGHYVLGGGSLIPAESVLRTCEALARTGARAVLFGTGFADQVPASPAIRARWTEVLRDAHLAGVRGRFTRDTLAAQGVRSEVVGDLALLANLDLEAPRAAESHVVVSPRSIRAPGLRDQDADLRELLAGVVRRLQATGIPPVVFSASSDDHVIAREWAERLGARFVAYGPDREWVEVLRTARAILGARLHPTLFAAAWGVPAIALDTRGKYADALEAIGEDARVLDPAGIAAADLYDLVGTAAAEPEVARSDRLERIRAIALRQSDYVRRMQSRLALSPSGDGRPKRRVRALATAGPGGQRTNTRSETDAGRRRDR